MSDLNIRKIQTYDYQRGCDNDDWGWYNGYFNPSAIIEININNIVFVRDVTLTYTTYAKESSVVYGFCDWLLFRKSPTKQITTLVATDACVDAFHVFLANGKSIYTIINPFDLLHECPNNE